MLADECLGLIRDPNVKNKGGILAGFYKSLFGNDADILTTINKLSKVYGYEAVFFSILDCYDIDNFDYRKPYGLLIYFLKKRLDYSKKSSAVSLDSFASSVSKLRDKKVKVKENVI